MLLVRGPGSRMTVVGITGHMNLTTQTRALVAPELVSLLASLDGPLVGYTSLAAGADQMFAWSVLALGGDIVFVRPCDGIEDTVPAEARGSFRAARAAAVREVPMPFHAPSSEAYLAAGLYVADEADVLIAIWDGGVSGGKGGTADIVEHRMATGGRLDVLWPPGALRG